MRIKVNSYVKDVGKTSKKPFCIVGGMLTTARGVSYCEFFYDVEQPVPKIDGVYDLQCEGFSDREKKLQIRVVGLREAVATPTAKAA